MVTLKLVNEDITDALSLVPVDFDRNGTLDGEVLGNVPSAHRWGYDLDMTVPADWLLQGLEFALNWRWRDSEFRDPLTGMPRPLSGWNGRNFNPSFTYRMPARKLELGGWYWRGDESAEYRLNQLFRWTAVSSWGLWVETKHFEGWTISAEIEDPDGGRARRYRAIWQTDRRSPQLARTQFRERTWDPEASIKVRRSF